ncbi:MAG TPA: PD-(D/E)XK nuclease family protein, partial [Blastocatellia bacterium]|nr:PD-(D/E)XK nuclease family protein [Blastocatellia bacterium]
PGDELAVWSDAEAAEPKANLTATLRGSVIHRFCEKYVEGQDPRECLRECLTGVIALHASELRDRALEINQERAIGELMPFARNYLDSNVRRRIETVRTDMVSRQGQRGDLEGDLAGAGEFSERSFRLRRPLGVIAGTIDKLLVYPTPGTGQLTAEIIDFKTNRFRNTGDPEAVLQEAEIAAAAYRLQMQAYALAVRELVVGADLIIGTVHFLYQNVEVSIPHDQLLPEVAAAAVDGTMEAIVSSAGAEEFPVRPGHHCRVCNFLEYCRAGRLSLRGS